MEYHDVYQREYFSPAPLAGNINPSLPPRSGHPIVIICVLLIIGLLVLYTYNSFTEETQQPTSFVKPKAPAVSSDAIDPNGEKFSDDQIEGMRSETNVEIVTVQGAMTLSGSNGVAQCMERNIKKFSVRCCSDDKKAISVCPEETDNFSGTQSNDVLVTGYADANINDATEICKRYGRRLCTIDELRTVAKNTGCSYNSSRHLNVSSEKCVLEMQDGVQHVA